MPTLAEIKALEKTVWPKNTDLQTYAQRAREQHGLTFNLTGDLSEEGLIEYRKSLKAMKKGT